ncbi:phosphotransferase, partial [Candidatus Woesearchaeota archaeon]|nr:phosphotransferase [Candidatus Woesearchaeota archaeon]
VRRALKAGIKKVNLKRYFKDILLKSREKVFIKLNENEINAINDIFEKYLGDPKNFEYTPSLVHADLSKDHIFYDYKIKKIIGVIDFGDIQINDPLWDLIYLGSFGKVFEDYINSRKDSYFIKKKINLFLLTRALYGLKKAIKKKDEKKFDEERKEINKRIKQFYSNIFHY